MEYEIFEFVGEWFRIEIIHYTTYGTLHDSKEIKSGENDIDITPFLLLLLEFKYARLEDSTKLMTFSFFFSFFFFPMEA